MLRYLLACCGCLSLLLTLGCAMCASPHDCKYAAFGGVRERTDMVNGRVGSVFHAAPEISHVVRSEAAKLPFDSDLLDDLKSPPGDDGSESTENGADESLEDLLDDGLDLPELPDRGRIELPELPDENPGLRERRPLLETGSQRSAARNPLLDLFNHQPQ